MKASEGFLNLSFGACLIFWGIAGFNAHFDSIQTSYLRLFVTVLNVSVGLLIIFRRPVRVKGSVQSILISLPSLICGGLLFKLAHSLETWSLLPIVLFLIGGTLAMLSFISLGGSFAIFPDLRNIVSKGSYTLVRHPAYLGESIMLIALLIEAENPLSVIPFLLYIPFIVLRIRAEEKILSKAITYQNYQVQVKWKLIPFVW